MLPGFGGFVLKQRPAHFTPAGAHLVPPSRTVSFNSKLRQNDGILVSWLVEKHRYKAENALEQLNDFANYCRGVLENKRRLTLPGIGFFFLDFENNLSFEPLADHNFLPQSFGLTAVRVPEAAPLVRPPQVFADRPAAQQTSRKQVRNVRRMVTPLLLVALTLLVLASLISVGDFRGPLRAAIGSSEEKISYHPVVFGPLKLERHAADVRPLVSDINGIAKMEIDGVRLAVNTSQGTGLSGKQNHYEIILGCFSVPDNASRLVRRLNRKKIAAHILAERHRGMQVVGYGTFPDKESALQQLERVRTYVPAAWIRQVN